MNKPFFCKYWLNCQSFVLNKNVINFINELIFVGKTAAVLVTVQERDGVDYRPIG